MSGTASRRTQKIPEQTVADQLGDHGLRMIRFFKTGGYSVDIAALRRDHPEVAWHNLDSWIAGHDRVQVG